jgi:hypothetical protein
MAREHSIYLVNTKRSSTRDEIESEDRKVGDCFLKPLGLEYAGWSIVPDLGKRVPTWDLPSDKINEAIDFVMGHDLDGYSVEVWIGCEKEVISPSGRHMSQFSRRFA